MHDGDSRTGVDARRSPRVELDGQVTIRFDAGTITGSGQNISVQGVYLKTQSSLRVRVQVDGHGEVGGRLIRLDNMGDGQTGLAVLFDEPHPGIVPPTA